MYIYIYIYIYMIYQKLFSNFFWKQFIQQVTRLTTLWELLHYDICRNTIRANNFALMLWWAFSWHWELSIFMALEFINYVTAIQFHVSCGYHPHKNKLLCTNIVPWALDLNYFIFLRNGRKKMVTLVMT